MTPELENAVEPSNSNPSLESVQAKYLNLAAYQFVALDHLGELRGEMKRLASEAKLCGTILLSPEGINLFVAGEVENAEHFLRILRSNPLFSGISVKKSWTNDQPFRRMLVKIKREIIAFGIESIRPERRTSPKISPEELKAWLEAGKKLTLLDTRNDYEVELGTFHGATNLDIHHFRNFPEAAKALTEDAKENPLVMFCTGGIRCEKAGPYLEQIGFRDVYQLDGGILNYFERCGGAYFEGDCFVFDHRVAVTSDLIPSGAKLCFVCQATLLAEDIASDRYEPGVSCPKCYTSQEVRHQGLIGQRRQAIRRFAEDLPGSKTYENRRPMFVSRRYAGFQLIDWLLALNPSREREFWLRAIDANELLTGDHYLSADIPVKAETIVREGQAIAHVQKNYVEPDVDGRIDILYEDTWMVAVHKPSNLPCHASGQYCRNTLEYILGQVYRPEKLMLAHRIDSQTSGVVVLSRRHAVARKLQRQFADGSVEKTYLALVHGHPENEFFSCEARIHREPTTAGRRLIDPSGDSAFTQFRVLDRLSNGTSRLEVRPRSGRTHQIRLHLAHLGFPIVHDRLYGRDAQVIDTNNRIDHDEQQCLCLHAWRLALTHPISGQRMELEAPLPEWLDTSPKNIPRE